MEMSRNYTIWNNELRKEITFKLVGKILLMEKSTIAWFRIMKEITFKLINLTITFTETESLKHYFNKLAHINKHNKN